MRNNTDQEKYSHFKINDEGLSIEQIQNGNTAGLERCLQDIKKG